jgi:hypothetical protein
MSVHHPTSSSVDKRTELATIGKPPPESSPERSSLIAVLENNGILLTIATTRKDGYAYVLSIAGANCDMCVTIVSPRHGKKSRYASRESVNLFPEGTPSVWANGTLSRTSM